MVKLKIIFLVALFSLSIPSFSQKTKRVEGEYTYHAPENVTLEEAKHIALERAKIQALADVFGTIVSQNNSTLVENRNGESSLDFLSVGGSEVKGEWIETLGEPQYDIYYEQNMLVVKASVKGKAREIVASAIDFYIKVLRNGIDERFESYEFYDGDDLFLLFQSPIKGYLAIYLLDEANKEASCLLPYNGTGAMAYAVNGEVKYTLFSPEQADEEDKPYVRQYYLQCKKSMEYNTLYAIFSPSGFAISETDKEHSEIRDCTYEAFNKWLLNLKKKYNDVNVKTIPIKIKKKK